MSSGVCSMPVNAQTESAEGTGEGTGGAYLLALTQYLEKNEIELGTGNIHLKLSPTGVEYISQRIRDIDNLRTLKQEAFINYVLASVANKQDRSRLDKVASVLKNLSCVKIQSQFVGEIDGTRLDFMLFQNLTRLEIRGCVIGNQQMQGFENLLPRLRVLICCECSTNLQNLLQPAGVLDPACPSRLSRASSSYQDFPPLSPPSPPPSPSPFNLTASPYHTFRNQHYEWSLLQRFICTHNKLQCMDEVFHHLPHLEVLDLSSNEIETLEWLEECEYMQDLDLGKNRLTSLEPIKRWCFRRLVRLAVPFNELLSLDGVQELNQLTELDVRWNIIADFVQVRLLGGLSDLVHLRVQGNPVCHCRNYRRKIFQNLPRIQKKLQIDGKGITTHERQALRTRTRQVLLLGPYSALQPEDSFYFHHGVSPPSGGVMGGYQVAHISGSPETDSDEDGVLLSCKLERSATTESQLPLLTHDNNNRPWSSFSFREQPHVAPHKRYYGGVDEGSEDSSQFSPGQEGVKRFSEPGQQLQISPRSIPDLPTRPKTTTTSTVKFASHKVTQSADLKNALNEFFGQSAAAAAVAASRAQEGV